MQFTYVISAILAIVGFAMATPPACILAAMGVQGDPTDMNNVCVVKQEYVLSNLTASCTGSNLNSAYEYYSSTCLSKAQVTVSALPSGTTGSSTNGSSSSSTGSSTSGSASSTSSSKNSAPGVGPNVIFALSGLLATGVTSLFFL